MLPSIKDKVIPRPGIISKKFTKCFVPNPSKEYFWNFLYQEIFKSVKSPIVDPKIDPYFGNFGFRFHPIELIPNYFHIGVDIMAEKGTKVCPVANGLFEYSGYEEVNGKYVMISHPQIQTEDGFTLFSLYLHLQNYNFHFNIIKKIFRKMGFYSLTKIPIKENDIIGEVGDTGNAKSIPHLHLQLEFRNKNGVIVAINPALALDLSFKENLTSKISDVKELKEFAENNQAISKWIKRRI